MYKLPQYKIFFKELGLSDIEISKVINWRNSESAKNSFFKKTSITEGSHRLFMINKKENDIIFGIWLDAIKEDHFFVEETLIGMISVIVDENNNCGEYGRLLIDEFYKKNNYAKEATLLLFSYAFNVLNLDYLWLDVYSNNTVALSLYNKLGWKYLHNYCNDQTITRMIFFKEDFKE